MTKYGFIPPVMLSTFFILSLYSRNISLVSLMDIRVPILIAISIAISLYFMYHSIKEIGESAVVLSTITVGIIFSFGYSPIISLALTGLAILILTIGKSYKSYLKLTIPITIIVVCITMVPIAQVVRYNIAQPSKITEDNIIGENDSYPDIYYIIPDSYAGNKTLESLGYNNNDFSNFLINRGFIIPEVSHCNYARTHLSILSTLNMNYLDNTDYNSCCSQISRDTEVIRYLKSKGYHYIHIGSTMWEVTKSNEYADEVFMYGGQPIEFFHAVIDTTPMGIFWNTTNLREYYRYDILYQIDTLKQIPGSDKPLFVFCHLLIPHHGYIGFNSDGSFPNKDELEVKSRKDKYLGQVTFLNSQLEDIVNSIGNEAIIIIQSDEGASTSEYMENTWYLNEKLTKERGYIFSAYYLPGSSNTLYPNISPVNTFRVVFNEYFNENLELLPDRLYLPRVPQELETGNPRKDYYDATKGLE